MLRINRVAWVLTLFVGTSLVACGGGSSKKETAKPVADKTTKTKKVKKVKKKETEEDRAKKREDAAQQLVASGSTCLPQDLKNPDAKMALELGALGPQAILCAVDHDPGRMLGAVGCWNIDLAAGGLTFRDRNGIPGRGFHAKVADGCVRGYCLPKDQAPAAGEPALIAWSLSGEETAVAVGDHVHLFSAESKELTKSIALRDEAQGDKVVPSAPTGLWFSGDNLFLQAGEDKDASIWAYKTDGTAGGPLLGLGKGNPPVAVGHGSFSLLDKDRVAVAERGFSQLTIYEVATGKRSKLVRKISNGPCRSAQVESYFADGAADNIPAKCFSHLKKTFDHLVGTTMVAGSKNYLGALTSDRVGELAVIDSKNLSEKRSIKLPWCDAGEAPKATMKEDASGAAEEKAADDESAAGAAESMVEDPDAGGEAKAMEAEEEPAPAKKSKKKKKSSK